MMRVDVVLPVELSAGGPPAVGKTRVLGLHGLTAEVPETFPTGLEIETKVTAWSLPLHTRGRVVSARPLGDGKHLVELEFTADMSAMERELLAWFVATKAHRGG